jgi:hypothetical protein
MQPLLEMRIERPAASDARTSSFHEGAPSRVSYLEVLKHHGIALCAPLHLDLINLHSIEVAQSQLQWQY